MSLWWHMLNAGRALDQAHELAMDAMRKKVWRCGVCGSEMQVDQWHSCKSVTEQRPAARERRGSEKGKG